MQIPESIDDYLRAWAPALGERIMQMYPALQTVSDPVSPLLSTMLRKPFAAQALAIMGLVKAWGSARAGEVVAECGTGKTLISLGGIHCHSEGKPFTALAMVPPQIVKKWAREAFQTLPRLRVFLIDGLRGSPTKDDLSGVNEVRLRGGQIVREGLRTNLSELRLRRHARSARARWKDLCNVPALFIVGRDRAKLGYYWEHVYRYAKSGRLRGTLVNCDTGQPVFVGDDRLISADFKRVRLSEIVGTANSDASDVSVARRRLYSALWQADGTKTRRYAPIEFIGRYMQDFFDYAVGDEVHELKGGDTAQGNALGTLAGCAQRTAVLTGTFLGGYADDAFHVLFRLDPRKMLAEGFEHGEAGRQRFAETYGVLEKITVIEPAENACSKAKVTVQIRRRPGASPLLFGRFLMSTAAFVSLEDISSELPPYNEEVIPVEMDPILKSAYEELEEEIKQAMIAHPRNNSLAAIALNALMLYPDRPFHMGDLYGYEFNKVTQERERFLIASPKELDENQVYAKEQRLVDEVKAELASGRRCQIYAVYTQKRDVTRRLERILSEAGIHVAVLTTEVKPEQRESWYERQLARGIDAVICHPRLVQTGLDLLQFPTLLFYQTGYSIYTLRQASRRSWRIGQRKRVKVKFLHYASTAQEMCLRLMGKKLLVSLAMEGKFASDGLQAIDDCDDMLMAMARELVTKSGIGETADQVWRSVQQQYVQEFGVRPTEEPEPVAEREPETEVVEESVADLLPTVPPSVPSQTNQWLEIAAAAAGRRTRRGRPIPENQLALF